VALGGLVGEDGEGGGEEGADRACHSHPVGTAQLQQASLSVQCEVGSFGRCAERQKILAHKLVIVHK
jgi:hypothetical protein